jgi:hypothetical protein
VAIKIGADDRLNDAEQEEVWLPGRTEDDPMEGPYEFAFPRIGALMSAGRRLKNVDLSTAQGMAQAAIEEMNEQRSWLAKGFGVEAWAHIDERLSDVGDLLDEEHLAILFQQLSVHYTARPTTSSNGASRQPWKKPSTAAPSQQESDSVS